VTRISVSGPSRIVTDTAVAVGDEGGSVVDVAVVAALTAMCTEPGVCGPGAGGFITVDVEGTAPMVVDGYVAYPGIGFAGEPYLREVTMPYGGGVTTLVDAGSVGVPGALAALDVAWQRFGALPWKVLMEAVASAVADGFPLSEAANTYFSEGAREVFWQDPVSRSALFEGEAPKPVGAPIVFPGLADTLRHLGEQGASDFYNGDVARAIVDDLTGRGGQLTMEDMATYRAVDRVPVRARRGEWQLDLNPTPAVGGVAVARALELAADASEAELAAALTRVFEERRDGSLMSPSTVSVAAVDENGGAVAASFSAGYGSGVVPDGTGMLMNNSMGELELLTGEIVPGERMISNMAPTVARSTDSVVALGSPGADRITTALVTTLARLAVGDDLGTAIDHPRLHPEFGDFGVRIAAEPGLDLAGVGFEVRHFERRHMYFGGVNGAALLDGDLVAYADGRRTGSVGMSGG
jgi:gamma-glutamyltranspeptidase / glutathione hydrolase